MVEKMEVRGGERQVAGGKIRHQLADILKRRKGERNKMAKKLTASEIIRRKYKGNRYFMTPHKIKVGKLNPNVAYELSSGSGFGNSGRMYGVSVVSVNRKGVTKAVYDKSKAFGNRNEATSYIDKLKRKMQKNKRGRK
jgi:hypothetical protein